MPEKIPQKHGREAFFKKSCRENKKRADINEGTLGVNKPIERLAVSIAVLPGSTPVFSPAAGE